MYSKTTKKINITVKPYYLEDQSEPDDQHYVWAYKVTIDNQGKEKVQLVNRHWKIIDANGTLQVALFRYLDYQLLLYMPIHNADLLAQTGLQDNKVLQ